MGDFLCFAGTNFCDWEKWVFLSRELIFVIFRELPSIWNYNILDFWVQITKSNTGEQHADVKHINQLINGVPSNNPFL